MRTLRDGTQRPRRKGAVQAWTVAWMGLAWCLLWRDFSIANLLSGVLLGVLVQVAFPLPPLVLPGRIRPLSVAVFLLTFAWDMLRASLDVSWQVLRWWRPPRSAVLEVDLDSGSDLVLTFVSLVVTLVPGSVVVEARRSTHTLFVHVLDAVDADGVERAREHVLAVERRVVRALGADRPPRRPEEAR